MWAELIYVTSFYQADDNWEEFKSSENYEPDKLYTMLPDGDSGVVYVYEIIT